MPWVVWWSITVLVWLRSRTRLVIAYPSRVVVTASSLLTIGPPSLICFKTSTKVQGITSFVCQEAKWEPSRKWTLEITDSLHPLKIRSFEVDSHWIAFPAGAPEFRLYFDGKSGIFSRVTNIHGFFRCPSTRAKCSHRVKLRPNPTRTMGMKAIRPEIPSISPETLLNLHFFQAAGEGFPVPSGIAIVAPIKPKSSYSKLHLNVVNKDDELTLQCFRVLGITAKVSEIWNRKW